MIIHIIYSFSSERIKVFIHLIIVFTCQVIYEVTQSQFGAGLILELEMLVQDILDPKERNIADLVKNIDEEEDNPIISLSFCFTLQPRAYRAALAAVATLMK